MSLPIRKLTLYKHGISVVERGGQVVGERVTLTFHRDQMNDVLKSLVAFDRAGGQVRNIAYDAPEEREEKLARGSIRLSEQATLVDLLRDLRGRQVRVQARKKPGELTVTGLVVGLDVSDEVTFRQGRLSLLTERGIQVLRLQDVEQVALLDGEASADLDFFLRTSLAEPEQRTVTLRLSEGEHDLVVRYLTPSPTWRVSYRFVGEEEVNGTRRAFLQGWGIFDNPFDETLENLQVSLVSGMPISFVYDLYTPVTPKRPEVKEKPVLVAKPIRMEQAIRTRGGQKRSYTMAAEESADFDDFLMAKGAPAAPLTDALSSSTPVAAEGAEQGDLFEYRIKHPVTVQRGEAAMVPILGTEIPYRKEYIYNGQKQPRHPAVVLRFDNSSNLTLEGGPITVMEENTYVGEAILPFTRPNAEILLAIAVDQGVRVREEKKARRHTQRITIQGQFMLFHEYTSQQTSYEVNNNNSHALTLMIEHARQANFDLFGMREPLECTEEHYRWQVEVPAGPSRQVIFTVYERRSNQRREALSRLDHANLTHYLRNKWLDQALANELQELLQLYAEKQRLQGRLTEIESERNRLMKTQEQARKNMSGLKETGDEGALRARYVRQLNQAEDTLAALDNEYTTIKQEEKMLEQRIRTHIGSLGSHTN